MKWSSSMVEREGYFDEHGVIAGDAVAFDDFGMDWMKG